MMWFCKQLNNRRHVFFLRFSREFLGSLSFIHHHQIVVLFSQIAEYISYFPFIKMMRMMISNTQP